MQTNIILQGITISDFTQLVSDAVRQELQTIATASSAINNPKYLTTKEVAVMCGIAEITVHKLKKKGKLIGTYIGRSVRYSEIEVQEFLKANR